MDVGGDQFYLRKHYSEAIYQAGGIPVLLPLISESEYAQQLLKTLNGIVLSGSNSDVDPHRYGQEPHPRLGPIMTRRDQTDLFLLEESFRMEKPLLAICYGIQILNVFLGGTLWQDIGTEVKDSIQHSHTSPDDHRSHPVQVQNGSLLFSFAGQSDIRVNSYHHQGIRQLSAALQVSARAPDGIVEAAELRSPTHFVFGVQWHPEIGWETDPLSQKIFSFFVQKARGSRL